MANEIYGPTQVSANTSIPFSLMKSYSSVSGTVIDAVSLLFIAGANLNIRIGHNNITGDIYTTGVSDEFGNYFIKFLPIQGYTIEAIADGYISNSINVTLIEDQIVENQDIILSESLTEGITRIVLTWGELPTDLDSHLIGPDGLGGRFHVWYMNEGEDQSGSILDVDDTTSYGPETITINIQHNGIYTYYIHDFWDELTDEIATSGAEIKVYRGDSLIESYTPPNQNGLYWHVFDLNGDTFTEINTISDLEPS